MLDPLPAIVPDPVPSIVSSAPTAPSVDDPLPSVVSAPTAPSVDEPPCPSIAALRVLVCATGKDWGHICTRASEQWGGKNKVGLICFVVFYIF